MIAAKALLSIIALISTPNGVASRPEGTEITGMTLTWGVEGQLPSVDTLFDQQGAPIDVRDKEWKGGPILKGPQFGRYSCSCSGYLCIGPRKICKPLCEAECGGNPGLRGGESEPGETETGMTLKWDVEGQALPSVDTVFTTFGQQDAPIAAKDKGWKGGPILKGPQFGRYSCSCSGYLCIGRRKICKPLCEANCSGDSVLPGGEGEPGETETETAIP